MVDQLFVLREAIGHLRPAYDDTIVHVDLNNSSIQRLNNFYLNRSQYAQVIRNLAAMGVAAQAHDFIFAAPANASEDSALIHATTTAGHVYFGLALALEKSGQKPRQQSTRAEDLRYLEQTKWPVVVQGDPQHLYHGVTPLVTFSALASVARGLGHLSVVSDRDGVFRRMPLLVRYAGAFYPSLAFRVICDYLQVPPENIVIIPGKHIILRQARRPQASTAHDIVIPIDRSGSMIINYVGSWERLKHYNFADILLASRDRDELEMWGEELAGKLVVVSDVSTGSPDVGAIPFDVDDFPLSGLHTNIMHTILTETFLRPLSMPEMLGIELVLFVILFGLSVLLPSRGFAVGVLVVSLGYVGFGAGCFFYAHTVGNLLRPLLMVGFATISLTVTHYIQEEKAKLEGLRQRDRIRSTFGRYVSNDVVDKLLESPQGLTMGGEVRQITLLVSDLRGFTSLAARLSPHEVLEILNRYFERMLDSIEHYRGTVDELQGDGILAFFGAPWAAPDDPERAVACAIAMQTALRDLNAEQRLRNLPELAMGIGINTGEVIVGNIGSLKRTKYGAVGSAINTAYRIESYTVGGQILISPQTYAAVEALVQVHSTMQVEFKGLPHPVTLYDVRSIGGRYQLTLPDKIAVTLHLLPAPLSLACLPLSGKIVSTQAIPGVLTHLAGSAAEAVLQAQVEVYSNLKLSLTAADGTDFPDIYAKVLAVAPLPTNASALKVRLELTSIPDTAKAFLAGVEPASATS